MAGISLAAVSLTAPWALVVTVYIGRVFLVFALLISLFALIHCLFQRSAAFLAVGTLSKGSWAAIISGAMLLSLVFGAGDSFLDLFGLIALTASLVYLLDIRPALRDATRGQR